MKDDANSRRPQITTWETLKKKLKDQFLPTNTAWVARESLKRLRHIGSIRDYVKEFSSLMLDINCRGGLRPNFEGKGFMISLLPWLQQIAWWIPRGMAPIRAKICALMAHIWYNLCTMTLKSSNLIKIVAKALAMSLTCILEIYLRFKERKWCKLNHFRLWKIKKRFKWGKRRIKTHGLWEKASKHGW